MDPLELLHAHCTFAEEANVYLLMAVARKKENESLTNSKEIVFREVLKRTEDIDKKYKRMRAMIESYKEYTFRIYVSINPRDTRKAFFLLQHDMIQWQQDMCNGLDVIAKLKRIDYLWFSSLAKPASRTKGRAFLIDIDKDCSEDERDKIVDDVLPSGAERPMLLLKQKSPHGWHVVVRPFNRTLAKKRDDVEILSDGYVSVDYIKRR